MWGTEIAGVAEGDSSEVLADIVLGGMIWNPEDEVVGWTSKFVGETGGRCGWMTSRSDVRFSA